MTLQVALLTRRRYCVTGRIYEYEYESETAKRESEGLSALPSTCELLASMTVLTTRSGSPR